MLNPFTLLKTFVACFTLMGSSVVDKISPHEHTKEEIVLLQEKVEKKAAEMRADVDGKLGEGVFDGLVSGKIDVVEFLECEDLEVFLIENGYRPPTSEQTGQRD